MFPLYVLLFTFSIYVVHFLLCFHCSLLYHIIKVTFYIYLFSIMFIRCDLFPPDSKCTQIFVTGICKFCYRNMQVCIMYIFIVYISHYLLSIYDLHLCCFVLLHIFMLLYYIHHPSYIIILHIFHYTVLPETFAEQNFRS